MAQRTIGLGKNNGKYYSTGNRRLKVFKIYQEECEHEVCVTYRMFRGTLRTTASQNVMASASGGALQMKMALQ